MYTMLPKKERCLILATDLIENNSTVRAVAAKFGISKSTVHKDITQNLKKYDRDMYSQVQKILDINTKERHIRGGEATKRKYSEKTVLNNQTLK